jgi:hypothetical protein
MHAAIVRDGGTRYDRDLEHLRRRAEQLVARPGAIGAMGALADEVLTLRDEAERQLEDADGRLRSAAEDRLAAMARIRQCNRALVGTGQVCDATGNVVQYFRRRSDSFADPLPDGWSRAVIGGEELRLVLLDVLELLGRAASVGELVRLLAFHGFTTAGRPSQSVSNALSVELRAGRVQRVGRGVYSLT